ncbi:MAG TPA: ABC transporter substrate-binding protein [Candidatus Limnocylindria bacterium]|nr:ABC transporter substrate-binding protein [Candidatus Limnocylindria bacterium]
MKRTASLVLVCSMLLALLGLAAPALSETAYKDHFFFATANDQDTLDPQWNVSNDKVLKQVYSGLVTRNAEGTLIGDLATEWSVGEDQLTWTFKLREGVTFHDGTPFNAAAVKATYDRLMDTANPTRYTDQVNGFIAQVNVVDDFTVELVTKGPSGAFLANLVGPSHLIINPTAIAQFGNELGKTPDAVSGTGPYKVVAWDKDEQMEFEAFEDYYGGVPATRSFTILVIPEANSRTIAIETRQVDIADGISGDDLLRLDAMDGIKVVKIKSIGQHLFQFNTSEQSILKDARLRQAISYALDRQEIVDTLYPGDDASTAPLSPRTFGYHNFGTIQQDQAKARELMKEAGYENGFDIKLMVTPVYVKGVEMGELIKSQLAEVGINVNLEVVERAVFIASLGGLTPEQYAETYGYNMFIMGAGPSTADAHGGLHRIWVTDPAGVNTNNYGFYSNKRVDELLNQGAAETDQEKRKDIYREAMQILYLDDPVGVWMNDRYNAYVMSDKVENFSAGVTGVIYFNQIKVAK